MDNNKKKALNKALSELVEIMAWCVFFIFAFAMFVLFPVQSLIVVLLLLILGHSYNAYVTELKNLKDQEEKRIEFEERLKAYEQQRMKERLQADEQ